MSARTGLAAMLAMVATACAHYQAAPIDPEAFLARYEARSTHEPGFVAWFASLDRDAAESRWSPEDYALASLYFRASLDEARAEVRVAAAAEVTAGARERPGLAGSGERNLQSSAEPSPWGVQLTPTFVIATGGKRGARIAIATARTLAATARLQAMAWRTANEAREAAVDALLLAVIRNGAEAEMRQMDSLQPLMQQRLAEGAVNRVEVARARVAADRAHLAALQARNDWTSSQARLAMQVGVPPDSLPPIPGLPLDSVTARSPRYRLRDGEWERGTREPATLVSGPRDSLRILALGSRWEIAEALASYQVAEGELRLAIANQRPDLQLGPGLFFDHGITRFLVNFVLPVLPGGQHGPIAEAEARRVAAARHLDAIQEAVLAEVDAAFSGCTIATTARDSSSLLRSASLAHAEAVHRAFDRGEIGRMEVAQAVLEDARAAWVYTEYLFQVARARASLEAAVGAWWQTQGNDRWPDVTVQPVRTHPKEAP